MTEAYFAFNSKYLPLTFCMLALLWCLGLNVVFDCVDYLAQWTIHFFSVGLSSGCYLLALTQFS